MWVKFTELYLDFKLMAYLDFLLWHIKQGGKVLTQIHIKEFINAECGYTKGQHDYWHHFYVDGLFSFHSNFEHFSVWTVEVCPRNIRTATTQKRFPRRYKNFQ